jgi:hypothetical protein
MAKKLDDFIEKSVQNIEQDRAVASFLLTRLVDKMADDTSSHQNLGHIAAQYLETLQRSNEQMVKLTAIVQKKDGNKEKLSLTEIDDLFDTINRKE